MQSLQGLLSEDMPIHVLFSPHCPSGRHGICSCALCIQETPCKWLSCRVRAVLYCDSHVSAIPKLLADACAVGPRSAQAYLVCVL